MQNMKNLVSITGNILHVLCAKREGFRQYHWFNAARARRISETKTLNDEI